MGSPTSDDDPTRRLGPGGVPGGQGQPQPPGAPHPESPHHGPRHLRPHGAGPSAPGSSQPWQTAPFPQPGGPYPPPGGPGYGAPPGPPHHHRRPSNRVLTVALVVGLVVLVALGVALVIAFTRDGGDKVSAGPSTSAGTAPAPSSVSTGSSPVGTTSSAPASTSASARTDGLLAAVPSDLPDCAAADLAGNGDVAAVECGASTTRPGPSTATFHLYDTPSRLGRAFSRDAAGIDPMPAGQTCATAEGVTVWNTAEGAEGGQVACAITRDGLLIAWTDRAFGIEGVVTADGSTQADLAALADWWRSHSDFRR